MRNLKHRLSVLDLGLQVVGLGFEPTINLYPQSTHTHTYNHSPSKHGFHLDKLKNSVNWVIKIKEMVLLPVISGDPPFLQPFKDPLLQLLITLSPFLHWTKVSQEKTRWRHTRVLYMHVNCSYSSADAALWFSDCLSLPDLYWSPWQSHWHCIKWPLLYFCPIHLKP